MFLRAKRRFKDGKEHRYWSIVENRRCGGNRVVQRQVLYLGEINDQQHAAWCKTIEVVQAGGNRPRQVAIFPEDRKAPELSCDVVQVKLNELQLRRARQWGACWLACEVWDQLRLDDFWSERLRTSRQGTRWLNVFKTQVVYRLIDPGSEWRLHRQWFEQSAMADLLGEDFAVVQKDKLYRCLDQLLAHKRAFFSYLKAQWEALFQPRFDILLYDLTSTYLLKTTDTANGLLIWLTDMEVLRMARNPKASHTTTLADRLRSARKKQRWTQQKLADAAGCSQALTQKIETGKCLRPRNVFRLARALNVSPAWLMFRQESFPELNDEGIEIAAAWSKLSESNRAKIKRIILSATRDKNSGRH